MKRNSSVDIIKFVFSIIIILYHFGFAIWGGYIVVEGFFMITGFLMMSSMTKATDVEEVLPDSTARFVLRKYSSIFFPLLFSALIGFFAYEYPVEYLPRLLFEVFPMQMAGLDGLWVTGVSWYLSAMLLSVAILHLAAKKNPEQFGYSVAPILCVLSYGLLCLQIGHLDVSDTWIFDFLNAGILRAVAGMSAGFVLFLLVKRSKKEISPVMRGVYSVLEIGGWAGLIYFICASKEQYVGRYTRTSNDFIVVALIFGLLYLAFSGKTVLALVGSRKITGVLATASTYIFLNHYYWKMIIRNRYATVSVGKLLPLYLLMIALSSVLAWGLTEITYLLIRKLKKVKNGKK